jgi:MbtH protein
VLRLKSGLNGGEFEMSTQNADGSSYKVVVNHAEQYSICRADRQPPAGWREVGQQGPIEQCVAYIQEVLTDLRPLSLREWLPAYLAEEAG